jgi:hypothetical protein
VVPCDWFQRLLWDVRVDGCSTEKSRACGMVE